MMKNIVPRVKPTIDITLDDQQDAFVPSYTSLDQIKGQATITSKYDTSYEQIYLTFEGTTKTLVEKIATTSPANGRTEAFQVFLRLIQPLDHNTLPESRILKAGQTYRFPFTFVVPEKLLPQSCMHARSHDGVQDIHLNLPPSLGDPMAASAGKMLRDDMAPEMSVISYAIKVRMTCGKGNSGKPVIAAESSKRLRIVPAVDERKPIKVYGGLKDDYRQRKEKSIKKGLFRGNLGRLTMESSEPRSLRLPTLRSKSNCPVTTMAAVNLRFDPAKEKAQPPKLSGLSAKLKVTTFFGSVPMTDVPGKITDFYYSSTKGVVAETISLSSRCVASAQWERHYSNAPTRRDSAFSQLSSPAIPEPSSSYSGNTFYTAKILVPITLPLGSRIFVPTFHSCLVSRTYALDMYLTINSPSPLITAPSIHIKVPIQISMEASPEARPSISSEEAEAIAAREVETYFLPRNVTPPNSEHATPGYSEIFPNTTNGLPSPDYSEDDQPLATIRTDVEHVAPPGYSSFSPRNGIIRTDMMTPMGTPPIRC